MRRFGSWSEYRAAPSTVIEEQIIAWDARLQAEADHARENAPKS